MCVCVCVCMYVCMYMCVCMCVYICVCVCVSLTWNTLKSAADELQSACERQYNTHFHSLLRGLSSVVPTHLLQLFTHTQLMKMVCMRVCVCVCVCGVCVRISGVLIH